MMISMIPHSELRNFERGAQKPTSERAEVLAKRTASDDLEDPPRWVLKEETRS